MSAKIEAALESGTVVSIPLNKLKKSPRNARKTPHAEADIEALAASITAKGMLQNLVVEPELDADGSETGNHLVTIGEGRRLAQLLRVKRKEIKKNEPIRCVLDTEHDAHEISLAENVIRTNMHPADQFEAFKQLADERGMNAEDIAARFGVTPQVVRQRLRLGAVSPKLMQVYRDGGLTLEQLMAFGMTEDHARQEHVFEALSYNKEPSTIRRMLTDTHVSARDRRARFVGAAVYQEAGGAILRDLFTEDYGGYFEDSGLLDRLATEKLEAVAHEVLNEGWQWAQAAIDFPHSHGMRRIYPHPVPLSPEDQERFDTVQKEFDALSAQYESAEELPDDVDAKFGELEAEIERFSEQQHAFDQDDIARSGVFVGLNHDGTARIERGFVRPEDEQPSQLTTGSDEPAIGGGERGTDGGSSHPLAESEGGDAEVEKPLSDLLVRDLTAHRRWGCALFSERTRDVALLAMIHALVVQTFYDGHDVGMCLAIKSERQPLAGHADGIEDTQAAKTLADRHAAWARQVPEDPADLWEFVVALDQDSRMALFAHCAALTVFAVRLPWDKTPDSWATANAIAQAVALDMTVFWTPTVRSYFGRVPKARIVEAVREAVSDEAAEQIESLKKQPMAETAEQLVIGTGWLPVLLRTPAVVQSKAPDETYDDDALSVAAE
jgi:ParB family chromosome partitioning protein